MINWRDVGMESIAIFGSEILHPKLVWVYLGDVLCLQFHIILQKYPW